MNKYTPSGDHRSRTPNGGGAPSQRSHRGSRGGRNRTTGSRYSRGSGETMNTDDVGDTVIVSGTDTSDTPEVSDTNRSSGSFARPEYAQSAGRSPRGASRSSGRGPARGGSRDNSRFNSRGSSFARSTDRGPRTESGDASRPRAWSPERDRSSRGGRTHGGSRAGSGSRGGRGGGRGGRRFSAPDLDIERFIEKSTRENADHKARSLAEPVHVVTNDFASLITHPKLREQVLKKGYTIPTPIQDQAIPHVYLKKDVVGIANTGTGKTAAFLIPLIDRALIHEHEKTLIVVPTRELATQIHDEFLGFSRGLGMSAAVVIGGVNIRPQISAVRNARFVIGTPGRLKDLIERRSLDMKSFTAIVLDEADRMLDMGFIPDIRFLMERMHHERHSLCFSATMPPEIEKLVNEFLKSPISVSTRTSTTSHAVDQSVVRITEGSSKMGLLEELLRDPSFDKVIVFGATKHGVERLTKQLSARGIRAESIHGNKSSNQRKRALDAFKLGRTRVLVATDVAARGLDISDVSHVINFDVPNSYDDYVHRIGRTGRAGKVGKALTFVEGNR